MDPNTEYGWAAFCTNGIRKPFIHVNSVRYTRKEVLRYMGKSWARDGERPWQGWKRAYRNGWRCVRVSIDLAFARPPAPGDAT